ncbi:histone-lysine N-methyltransferase SETMAR-like [Oppia nitens]|uniref:histone-lysine N-methyltransferase SETMAR-like n=1 Tax=Oppia nitens TaxID=1686743 RepID=UPI0023DC08CC|nr:histone-lysine N-methyltransferase SETMAR-like [Oppia nitens]
MSNWAEATKRINEVYPESIGVRKVQRWFDRFKSNDRSLVDKSRGHPTIVIDNEVLLKEIEADPRQTLHDLSHKYGYIKSENGYHMICHPNKEPIDRDMSTFAVLKDVPFLEQIVTMDEKWVYYENPVIGGQWVDPEEPAIQTPKRNLNPRKAMLCVWWDWISIIHYEVLEYGRTITSELYCQQLDRLKEVLMVVPHPPYSPDIAPSDYYLFRNLQTFLNGKTFTGIDDIKKTIDDINQRTTLGDYGFA